MPSPPAPSSIARAARRRRWLGRGALAAGSLALSLLVVEVGLRVRSSTGAEWLLSNSPALYDTSIFEASPEGGWVLRPGAVGVMHTPEFRTEVRVSQQGTRGADVGAKPAGALRVLTVGDSITLGAQVAEDRTFQALLAEPLSAATGRPVDLLNAGVDSYGTWAATRQVRRLAAELDVDAVLLTFFLGNDLQDNVRNRRPRPARARRDQAVSPLLRWSFLWTYVQVARSARAARSDPGAERRYREELAPFTTAGVPDRVRHASRDALRELARTADQLGVRLLVALAPPAFVVHQGRLAATLQLAGLRPEDADVDGPAGVISGQIPAGVAHLDLTAALREAARSEALYFTLDGHWTPAGHAVVAQALRQPLAELLAAPGPSAD